MGRSRKSFRPRIDALEGRTLMHASAIPNIATSAMVGRVRALDDTRDRVLQAIMSAFSGGPGSEFVPLVLRKYPNPLALAALFQSGAISTIDGPGFAAKVPSFQELYTGRRGDELKALIAGAVLLNRGRTLELATIVDGPINEPAFSQYVFGIDRGRGPALGSPFSNRPRIRFDAVVVVTRQADGAVSAAVTDLVTNKTTPLPASKVQIEAATLRVFVPVKRLPSTGKPLAKYRFNLWPRGSAEGGVEAVASFVPEAKMIPIGVLGASARTR